MLRSGFSTDRGLELRHRGTEVLTGRASYRLLEGRGIRVRHFGEELRLAPGAPVVVRPETAAADLPRAA